MGDKVAPYIYPIIKGAFIEPTPEEMEKRKNEGE